MLVLLIPLLWRVGWVEGAADSPRDLLEGSTNEKPLMWKKGLITGGGEIQWMFKKEDSAQLFPQGLLTSFFLFDIAADPQFSLCITDLSSKACQLSLTMTNSTFLLYMYKHMLNLWDQRLDIYC